MIFLTGYYFVKTYVLFSSNCDLNECIHKYLQISSRIHICCTYYLLIIVSLVARKIPTVKTNHKTKLISNLRRHFYKKCTKQQNVSKNKIVKCQRMILIFTFKYDVFNY